MANQKGKLELSSTLPFFLKVLNDILYCKSEKSFGIGHGLPFPWPKPREDTNMTERTGIITIHGNPLTLVGEEIKAGMPAPDTELVR